jgi:quinoprotein glucose dehydrogenase
MRPVSTLGARAWTSLAAALVLVAACDAPVDPGAIGEARLRDATSWPSYGGDPGGQRYSPLTGITPQNVDRLEIAWTHHTGDVSDGRGAIPSTTAFEATPILVDGVLYLCSPFNRVIALDPETGAVHWSFDPEIDLTGRYANQLICRGVSTWLDPDREPGTECRRRILMGTNDAFLIALDARTGAPCPDFGEGGRVDLNRGVGEQRWKGEYQVTSPPAVVHDLVVVGSAVSDNARIDAPSGVVRAFDARSGALRWAWDLAPPDFRPGPDNVGQTITAGPSPTWTTTEARRWRSAARPARWCGAFRPCTTTSGTTTSPRSRR